MRSAINDLLPDTCNILTGTVSIDSEGGATQSWGTASAGVACRLDMRNARKMLSNGAIQPFTTWVMTLPYGTSVTELNRIEHGTFLYSVKPVDNDKSWGACVRVEVEKL
jgi:hypothetical protein